MVTLEETGAETKTNEDGRYTLPTNFSGSGKLIFKFPGKENVRLPFTISDEMEGNVLNLPDVVMGE